MAKNAGWKQSSEPPSEVYFITLLINEVREVCDRVSATDVSGK